MIANWAPWLCGPRAQAVLLLLGLGALAIGLFAIMLTRWGQAKPLSKCVALSIFAHILLIAYAYGIRFFWDTPRTPHEECITVTLAAPIDQTVEKRDRQSEAPASPADAPPPAPQVPDLPRQTASAAVRRQPIESARAFPLDPPLPQVAPPQKLPAKDLPRMPQRAAVAESEPDVAEARPDVQRLLDRAVRTTTPELLASDRDDVAAARPAPMAAATEQPNKSSIPVRTPPLVPVIVASANAELADPEAPGPIHAPRPTPPAMMPAPYRARIAPNRRDILLRHGGTAQSESAVQAALVWLAENQESDGRWDCRLQEGGRETRTLGHDRRGAGADADTAVTGLALLAFSAAGHTHRQGTYRRTVQRGLEYLLRAQAADGNLAGRARLFARMYCHGIATLAISEAYAMTGDRRLEPAVRHAIQYTVRAQNPIDGGWRYQPGDPGDTSQLGWQLMALKSAELGGIPIPTRTRAGMIRFLNSVAAGRYGGLAGYRPRAPASRPMTAEALVCRQFLELEVSTQAESEAIARLLQQTPQSGPMNLYYWYYASLALHQIGGPAWQTWNDALGQRLLAAQQTTGPAAGSWPPQTVWGGYGGRVYSTAMAALSLEVYYRYLPLLQ